MTDVNGAVVWSADYRPFGQADVTVNTVANNFRFPGQYEDEETGLHYNWQRYYDSGTGRYISADPIGLSRGINLYSYAGNNPLRFVDPLGLAYFAKRPLAGMPWMGPGSCNPIDDFFNTEISHEQLFFEDGKSPSNIGFFDDGTLKTEPNPTGYRCRSRKYNDCIMRKAVANVGPLSSYCLFGKNCQTWAERVRKEYARFAQDPKIQKECKECKQ
jgi:RHS repeat-associated protein